MLVFRIACAIMLATAMNWSLGRPEAALLLEEVDEMVYFGPIAGALVGFFILAKRQGNGLLIGTANGAWIGVLTIAIAGVLYLTVEMWVQISQGTISDFENFMRIFNAKLSPLIESSTQFWLVLFTVGSTTVVGFLTEVLRWCLRWARKARGEEEPKEEVRAGVAKAGGALS